ncbi:MAG: hypothetical protein M1455_08115 [Actinobacteria bacterium]|nr:hypothetical protein [Actinomycetota bacterium]
MNDTSNRIVTANHLRKEARVDKDVWDHLDELGKVDAALKAAWWDTDNDGVPTILGIDEFLKEANKQQEFKVRLTSRNNEKKAGGDKGSIELGLRRELLSEIYAREAAADSEIVAFREEVLGGKLLEWGEVETWIEKQIKQEEADDLPTHWLSISLPVSQKDFQKAGLTDREGNAIAMTGREYVACEVKLFREKLKYAKPGININTKSSTKIETLAYSKQGDKWPYHKAIKIGGVLDKLREISKALAEAYGWHEAEATSFILADIRPWVGLCSTSSNMRLTTTIAPRQKPRSTWRIKMTIDPMLTDKQVARVYRQARREMLGRNKAGCTNYKAIREKSLRLALFFLKQPSDIKAANRTNRWNKDLTPEQKKEGWEYNTTSRLSKEGKETISRILNPKLGPFAK